MSPLARGVCTGVAIKTAVVVCIVTIGLGLTIFAIGCVVFLAMLVSWEQGT